MEIRRSDNIGNLIGALAEAQSNFGEISRNGVNPEFESDYPTLAHEIRQTAAALAGQGIKVLQFPEVVRGRGIKVSTMIAHKSGEFLAFDLWMPAERPEDGSFDCQSIGSALKYARRYSYESALCIDGSKDDDGNAAAGRNGGGRHAHNGNQRKAPEPINSRTEQMSLAVGSGNGRFAPPDDSSNGYSL